MGNKYSGDGKTLTKKERQTIELLLSERTIEAGIKAANISKTTFYEYLKRPLFRLEFEKHRKILIDAGLHTLKMATEEAATTMRKLLLSERESIRLRAASEILTHVSRFLEIEDLNMRLLAIENELGNGKTNNVKVLDLGDRP